MDQYDKMRIKQLGQVEPAPQQLLKQLQSALRKENIGLIDNFDVFARSTPKEINDEIREINKEDSPDNKRFGMKVKQKKS